MRLLHEVHGKRGLPGQSKSPYDSTVGDADVQESLELHHGRVAHISNGTRSELLHILQKVALRNPKWTCLELKKTSRDEYAMLLCIEFIVIRRRSSALTSPPTKFAKVVHIFFGRPKTYPTSLTMSFHTSEPTSNNLSSSRNAIEAESSGEDAQAATTRYLLTPVHAFLNPLRLNMVTSVLSSQSLTIPSTPSDRLKKKRHVH